MNQPYLNIPAALRACRGWLVWRYELGPGESKPRKVPVYVNGQRRHGQQGGTEDRKHLATFEQAAAVACTRGYEGLALAMLADWGLVGLDFDHCIDEKGGVHPEVAALVAGTYAERSPSGQGIRAFMTGALKDRKSLTQADAFGFEVFHAKGFLTVTGNHLNGVCDVAPLQSGIQALYEERFSSTDYAPAAEASARLGLSIAELRSRITVLSRESEYEDWLKVGMALHHETEGSEEGLDLWDEWSQTVRSYQCRDDLAARWERFGQYDGPPITAGWLTKTAREQGWIEDVAQDFDVVPVQDGHNPLPSFKRNQHGQILTTHINVELALQNADICGAQIGFDAFRDQIIRLPQHEKTCRPFIDADYFALALRLESIGFKSMPNELLRRAVHFVAKQNTFDSAIDWIKTLVHDGVPRIDTFLRDYLHAEDTPYTRAVSRYLWTALAGRALQPGCKADMSPIFVGAQGIGKSAAVAALAPNPEHYIEIALNARDDDLARKMRGRLIGEINELRGLQTKDLESVKAFITRSHEEWVPKYLEFTANYPRRIVFIGTTNQEEFLADETGNRRWLPVKVVKTEIEAIQRDVLQLWAEARDLYRLKGICWQEAEMLATDVHTEYMVTDVWTPIIEKWLDTPEFGSDQPPRTSAFLQVHEVLQGAIGMEVRAINHREKLRVSKILRRLGYQPALEREGRKVFRIWKTP